MDENKNNPQPENAAEDEQKPENEFEQFMAQQDNAQSEGDAEAAESDEEAAEGDAQPLSDEEKKAFLDDTKEHLSEESERTEREKKSKNRFVILTVIFVICVIVITGVMLTMILKRGSVDGDAPMYSLSESASGEMAEIDVNELSNTGDFIYIYTYLYNTYYYYGMTDEQIREEAVNQMKYIDALYLKAKAEGYTLSEEDNATVEQNLASVATGAESYSMTEEEFLEENFCPGYTIEMFKRCIEKQILAQKYLTDAQEEFNAQFEAQFTDESAQELYAEISGDYDVCDVSYYYIESTDESAQQTAQQIIAASGDSGLEAAVTASGGSSSSVHSLKGYTSYTLSQQFGSDIAQWVYKTENGEYSNGAGAAEAFTVNGMTYIFYVNNAPTKDETVPVTVEYIQVEISEDSTVQTADELRAAAKAIASELFTQAQADKGASLSDIYSNSDYVNHDLVSCDAYEDMTRVGSYDSAIVEWAFAQRSVNDVALVEGADGWYVLRFVSADEKPVWYQSVYAVRYNELAAEWQDALTKDYEAALTVNNDAVDEAIAYIAAKSASSAS